MPRKAGVPNKNKRGLLLRLKQQYGDDFHPIMKMAKNCVELQKEVEQLPEGSEERKEAILTANGQWARIAEYTEPKLKAVEHAVDGLEDGAEVTVTFKGKGVGDRNQRSGEDDPATPGEETS